ncbi:NADPH-dependent F420 reductase [Cellulomonas marina]|uniref:Pyrroline-5-carboxylate reductase catalytic N-terminal domain-containing protein n=1 Tax=Cellulomonas marina TaxID=988821 RepID=A0A1I1A9M9_9CELL|nr:NADPH-dependent F420 reductase [Cellulomonas marina]GIG30409.1 NADP oxidoreductase [Cellulomonas marina]SFB34637.1 hypothetical protein SAMN05421867_11637 [Cellulomonas marina]
MTTIGFIGAGHIGSSLARLSAQHGYDVVLSNSRGPETLADLVADIGPRARAATAQDAAAAGDLVVVTIPLKAIGSVPAEPLVGKVVVDTNNYYPQRDGQIAELDDESTTTAELLQAHLPGSRVVKAFNHIMASHLLEHAQPDEPAGRRALVVAGDDTDAVGQVAALIHELGFDTVTLQPLSEGWRIQRDTPGYGVRLDVAGLQEALGAARRYRDM